MHQPYAGTFLGACDSCTPRTKGGLVIRPAAIIVLSVCVKMRCLFFCCLPFPSERAFLSSKFFGQLVDTQS